MGRKDKAKKAEKKKDRDPNRPKLKARRRPAGAERFRDDQAYFARKMGPPSDGIGDRPYDGCDDHSCEDQQQDRAQVGDAVEVGPREVRARAHEPARLEGDGHGGGVQLQGPGD